MRFAVFATSFLLAVSVACGSGDRSDDEERAQGSARGANNLIAAGDGQSLVRMVAPSGMSGNLQQPTVTSEGITVTGYGTATERPDAASIQLTISGSDPFSSGVGSFPGFSISFIEPQELEPIVEALKAKGVSGESIDVNTFGQDQFGTGQGAAIVTFEWPKTDGVTKLADELKDLVADETDYVLSGFRVLFTVEDCESLEERAQDAAIDDARKRAERLAGLADLNLGDISGIAEGGGALAIYGLPQGCASIDELNPYFGTASNPHNSPDDVRIEFTLTVTFAAE